MSTPWLRSFILRIGASDPRLRHVHAWQHVASGLSLICLIASKPPLTAILLKSAASYARLTRSSPCLVGTAPGDDPSIEGELEAAGVFSRHERGRDLLAHNCHAWQQKAATARIITMAVRGATQTFQDQKGGANHSRRIHTTKIRVGINPREPGSQSPE